MEYTLTAQLGSLREERKFEARDTLEATIEAISIIMNSAHPNREPWASGRIILKNENDQIIHEMKPK